MILHIDMDAFFASVEQRDAPELKGKPVAVGGRSNRSVVAAASYEARAFGIRSAMPMFQAIRLCPDLIILPVDKPRYASVSRRVMAVLHRYTPRIEQVSIDEAYLDIAGCHRLFGGPLEMATSIQTKIFQETFLSCSIGVAPAKFLAKIASDINKPGGIFIIEQTQALDFARTLDIRKVPGVGMRAMEHMQKLRIRNLGDILKYDPEIIIRNFGKFGHRLLEYAEAKDSSRVDTEEPRKSISAESTLETDTSDLEEILNHLHMHAVVVARELRKKKFYAGNVVLKLKFSDFTQVTRQKRIALPCCDSSTLFREVKSLLQGLSIKKPVRLTGVGASSLFDNSQPRQMDLFHENDPGREKRESLEKTLDAISDKFGKQVVTHASFDARVKRPNNG